MYGFKDLRLLKMSLVLFAVTGFCQATALADEQNGETSLGSISVTAEAETVGTTDIPAEYLNRSQSKDMKDVFSGEPSVTIGGGKRSAQRLYLRGIESTNLNITIDGASQGRNNLFQHQGGIGGIEPDLLKRVQIDTAPSADSGPGALGGGIRFETVDAQDLLSPGSDLGFTLKSGYATADESWKNSAAFYGVIDGGLGILGHVSNMESEDYRIGGGGDVVGSAGENQDYFLKLSLLEQAGHSLRVSAQHNVNSGLYKNGSTGSDMGYLPDDATLDDLTYMELERQTYVFDHRYQKPGSKLIDTQFNVYQNEVSRALPDSDSETITKKYGGKLKNTALFELAGTAHKVTFGADYFSEDGTVYSGGEQQGYDSAAENLGVFIQERISAGPVVLSLGGRFDDFSTEFGSDELKGNEFSPNATVELEALRELVGFASYGEAVRVSSVVPVGWLARADSELEFNQKEGKDSYGEALKPESSIRREAGIRYTMNDMLRSGDRINMSFSLFKTDLKNLISQIGGQRGVPVTSFYNEDTIYSKGWEFRAGWSAGAFTSSFGYTHVDTEDKDGNAYVVTRRVGGSTGDRFVWDNRLRATDRIVLGYTMTAVGSLERETADDVIDRPGYVLHDLQAEWSPKAYDGMKLSLVVNNLLDRKYSEQTSLASSSTGIVHEPGRDIRMQVAYRF